MKELDKKIIELYKEMAQGHGLTDSLLSTIFARLYIEPEPVAMEDLAKETGYSLASISNKLKMLGAMMPIRRTRKPGTKKIFLYMEKDIFKIWKESLMKNDQLVLGKVRECMPDIIKEYKQKAKTEIDKKKVQILEKYYEQTIKMGEIFKKILTELEGAG